MNAAEHDAAIAEQADERSHLLGDGLGSQVLRIVTLVLVVAVLVGVIRFGVGVSNLDQDNKLIDRGQQVTNCIGDRADYIDDWRGIVLEQFLIQVQNVSLGREVDVALGLQAERNIRLLVQERREIRDQSRRLIAADDPDMAFVCPDVPDALIPPPVDP